MEKESRARKNLLSVLIIFDLQKLLLNTRIKIINFSFVQLEE